MRQVERTPEKSRIETLDVIRGVAICGILPFNILSMGMLGKLDRPAFPAVWNLDWSLWGLLEVTLEGSMRGLFTLLFGAGMLLMLRRAEGEAPQVEPVDVWTRRCLALGALGLFNCLVLLFPLEILWQYAVAGFALLAFRTARPRHLLAVAALCLAGFTALRVLQTAHNVRMLQDGASALAAQAAHRPLSAAQAKAAQALLELRGSAHPTARALAEEVGERTHWPSVVGWSWGAWAPFNFGQLAWRYLLQTVGSMLIGMALFRMGVLTGGARSRVYAGMVGLGYVGGFTLRGFGLWVGAHGGFDPSVLAGPPWVVILTTADGELARMLVTLGHLGLIVLLFRHRRLGRATPLRALGRMALTTYTLQALLTSVLFYGFGWVGRFSYAELMGLCVGIWIVTGVFAWAWLRRFDQGPVEALLRLAAYDTFRPGRSRRHAAAALALTPSV